MSPEQLSSDWDRYYGGFVREVHQLLAWGYEGAIDTISVDDEEPVITGRIVEAIEKRLDDVTTPDYYDKYERPHENLPDNKTGRTGKHRPQPDITIRFAGHRPRLEFTLEAKRLKTNGFPIREYVGTDGLGCFVRGDYACNCPSAAMLAYIQSDTPDRWFDQLRGRFNSDSSGSLGIKTGLSPVSVLPNLPSEWVSEHNRKNNSSIKVFHIFLDCCKPLH